MRHLIRGTAATVVLAGLVAAGCAPEQEGDRTAAADQVSEAEFREHAEEAYETYVEALRAGDLATAGMIWSEDIWIRGTGPDFESLQGRDEALEVFRGFLGQASLESMDVDIQDVIVLGDHAWESGTYDETFRMGEQEISLRGSYAALWRLEADGRWRIFRYIWNEHPEGQE